MKVSSSFGSFSKHIFCLFTSLILSFSIIYSQPNKLSFVNFTIENGLSNNLVHSIYQDKKGWMWFGTYQGLNRFDGYKFTIFDHLPSDSTSIGGSLIRAMFEDKDGGLWIGTEKKGIYRFNRDKDDFKIFSGSKGTFNLREQTYYAIQQDREGYLWLGTEHGLCKVDLNGKILKLYQHRDDDPNSIINSTVKVIQIDRTGKLWIGTMAGLDIVDPQSDKIIHLGSSIEKLKDEICTIFFNTDSKIWIGTYKYGIIIVDPLTLKYEHLIIDPLNERSLTVRVIARDRDNYWIGTRGGLYIYSKETNHFSYFKHDGRESESLIHNSVSDIYKDAKGDFWIATRGGISYVVKEKQVFQCYRELPNDNHYLNNGEIYAFWMDPQGKLWIGTESGGVNVFDRSRGVFSYIKHEKSANSLSNNCVKALMDDHKGNLWVGTFMGGVDIINLKSGHISHYQNQPANNHSLSSNKVWSFYSDSQNNIWVGTELGLDKYEPKTGTFIHYKNVIWDQPVIWIKEDSNHDLWVSSNDELVIYNTATQKMKRFAEKTRMMLEDNSGRFWITTLDKGLALFDKNKGIIKNYDQSKGIANDQTYCILEDNNGYFWISTINGLSRFDAQKETFKNFDKRDGLENNQFRYGACYKSPKGELIFGGITGFDIFNPEDIRDNEYEPPIVLTDFRIFNKHVPIGNAKNAIIQKSISETRNIVLPFDQNVITIEFAALNYAKSAKNKYVYKLEGFEKDWSDIGYQRTATYTNLNPGEYTFLVRASNSDNVWNKNNLELKITFLPPYWKTWWFKLLFFSAIMAILYLLFRFMLNRNHLQHELVYERERTKKLHELDMMKVRFFTNVSHEIRTPLTLITAPLEKMLQSEMSVKEMHSYHSIMNRNAQQLLRLINQLLDFRKSETGNLKLELSRGDLVFYLKDLVSSFSPLALEKNIKLEFNSSVQEIFTFFDADKLEKIINNLLSNSFKFTPDGGFVSVNLSMETERESQVEKLIKIVVKDSGVGIPESNMNKIFNRFFQAENAKNQTGTGIGLALTKELVKLHNGRIFVESIVGKGTVFTVYLPLYSGIDEEISALRESGEEEEHEIESHIKQDEEITGRILLVVDDNADVRFFIRSNFEPDFKVLEAINGKDGLSAAFRYIPDIIISDVLMPMVDGKEFCKRLKKDERTSHIPVILLTALSAQSSKMEGTIAGADDYITKPFDIILLKTKVENLLMLRNMLREKYSEEMVLNPKNIIIEDTEQQFLQKVIDTIEKNISNTEFDVDKLSLEVGVSRTQLYRKLTALTDLPVREFIKNIRLKRATQLLAQNKMNILDVSIAVGFKDLSHFRKCFRQEFGISPTRYANRNTDSKVDD